MLTAITIILCAIMLLPFLNSVLICTLEPRSFLRAALMFLLSVTGHFLACIYIIFSDNILLTLPTTALILFVECCYLVSRQKKMNNNTPLGEKNATSR